MIKLPTYELFIEDCEEIGLALVRTPAIETDFMYFNETPVKMSFNDDKMMVRGPALIPNQLIYRNDSLGERYIYFSEETIIRFVELLMSKDKNKFNLGHTDNYLNATLIESYFASEGNEFNVPINSWIVGLKIKDAEAWNRIKSGEFKGFSVQSLFSNELVNLMSNKENEMSKLKEKIMEALNSVIFPVETVVELETEVVEVPEVEETEEITKVIELSIDEKLVNFKQELLAEIKSLWAENASEFKTQVEAIDAKVIEFGKEPLSKSVKEEVAIPAIDKQNKATEYFNK